MSAMTYVMEELGDARMRCDQLLRYVDKATKLIEKSSHKDHFFEVAGDVIRGIPETSFKLHKALQAVALAANRIDYEEIKQDLRPEKVEELERVLKDVRVRQVQRRSQPMLNPGTVVEQLRGLAKRARTDGALDTDALGALIASLEVGAPRVADEAGATIAAQLEAMAHALENPPAGEMPSRVRLGQVLRKTFAQHVDLTGLMPRGPRVAGSVAPALDTTLKALEVKTEALKDARGEFMLPPTSPGLTPMFSPTDAAVSVEEAIASLKVLYRMLTATAAMRPGGISHAFRETLENLSGAARSLNLPDVSDLLGKSLLKTRVRIDRNASEGLDRVAMEEAQPRDLAELEGTLENLLANARLTKTFGGQGNYKKMFFNLMKVIGDIYTITNIFDIPGTGFLARVVKAIMPYGGARPSLNFSASAGDDGDDADETEKTAADDEKRSRHEEGKSVDPTKDMSAEDAKAWKENTDKYEDKFKAATQRTAKKIPAPDDDSIIREIMDWHEGQGSKLYSVGSMWNSGRPVDADDAEEAYAQLERKRADRDVLEAFEEHLNHHGIKVAFGHEGKLYVKYVKAGHQRREGPFDPGVAKRRLVALLEDGSITHVEFDRRMAAVRATGTDDWKAA